MTVEIIQRAEQFVQDSFVFPKWISQGQNKFISSQTDINLLLVIVKSWTNVNSLLMASTSYIWRMDASSWVRLSFRPSKQPVADESVFFGHISILLWHQVIVSSMANEFDLWHLILKSSYGKSRRITGQKTIHDVYGSEVSQNDSRNWGRHAMSTVHNETGSFHGTSCIRIMTSVEQTTMALNSVLKNLLV